MSYEKISEERILRIRHEITLSSVTDVRALKSDLANIPDSAVLYDAKEDGGFVWLKFIEDRAQ